MKNLLYVSFIDVRPVIGARQRRQRELFLPIQKQSLIFKFFRIPKHQIKLQSQVTALDSAPFNRLFTDDKSLCNLCACAYIT